MDRSQQYAVLSKLVFSSNRLSKIILADRRGKELVQVSLLEFSTPETDKNWTSVDGFRFPMENQATYFGPVEFGVTGEPFLNISLPVRDVYSDTISHVLMAVIRLKKLWELIPHIQVGRKGILYIVSEREERVIAHWNPSVIHQNRQFEIQEDGIRRGLDNSLVVLSTSKISFGEQALYIVAERPLWEAFELTIQTTVIILLLLVLALVASWMLLFLVVRKIISPIEKMTVVVNAMVDGTLSQRLEINAFGEDELGTLAKVFNTMADQLQDTFDSLEGRVKDKTTELENTNKKLVKEIEERKLTAEALTEMALFPEIDPAPVIKTDMKGEILLANKVAQNLVNIENLVGKSLFSVYDKFDGMDFSKLFHDQNIVQRECRMDHQDLLFTFLSDSLRRNVYIYGADISRLKSLEQQLLQSQKMEAIGHLAGGIAHDFNTLLGIVLGYGEMMRDDIVEGTITRDNLEEVIDAGTRAKQLVQQIMEFSRPSVDARTPLRLDLILEDSMKLLQATLSTNIEIRKSSCINPSLVLGNSTQLTQVIMNLGMNARDAIGEKKGVLELILEETDGQVDNTVPKEVPPGRYVKLTVRDSGCGIKPELMEHIFEPFFTTKEVGKGTGMGLSISHSIVKSHEGMMTVNSELDRGSSFQIYLPGL